MSIARSIRARVARGGAGFFRSQRDIIRAPSSMSTNMATNPLRLNIVLPVSKRNHLGQPKPLSPGDIVGMQFIIDGTAPISINFTGTAFGLDGLAQYADLAAGQHTLSVAVVTKSGVGKFTPPELFDIVDGGADAPVISFS